MFNPQKQVEYTMDKRRAYLGAAPSLALVANSFGYGTAVSWLAIQIGDLSEYSNVKTKLSISQIDELTARIYSQYSFLKLTEFMDFFNNVKLSRYGKFYGVVDPMEITDWLRMFIRDRNALLDKFAMEDEENNRKTDPEYQHWLSRYNEEARMLKYYSRNMRNSGMSVDEFREIWWMFNLGYERGEDGKIR